MATCKAWFHRKWIWIGVGYLWGFWFVLTSLTVLVLKTFDPEKSRPSIDDGASAPEQMSVQQRVMNAVSFKNMAQRMLHAPACRSDTALPDAALPCFTPR